MKLATTTGIDWAQHDALVAALAEPHRTAEALRRLNHLGPTATSAVRRGLHHPCAEVRVGCCRVLDHHMDWDALDDLAENMDHENPRVRSWAMHALACDRCKTGECQPLAPRVISRALAMLRDDPSQHVRQMAVGLLGSRVLQSAAIAAGVARSAREDPSPAVRKIARWWVPGGVRFEKLRASERRAARKPRESRAY